MSKKSLLLMLVLSLIVSMFLFMAGCGESEDGRHILRMGFLREIESLNPFVIWSVQAYEYMYLNYDFLVSWDENLVPIPHLARDWTLDEDEKTWTFYLQEGVTWQDGEPFTAEDVEFTFEYIRDNELGYFYDYVAAMEDITVTDELTVTITTSEPLSWMPQILVPILPKHIWSEIDPVEANTEYENSNPVGTGPFQVVEHVAGQYTRLVANQNYFKGAPALNEVILITYANADLMVEALKAGDLDIIGTMPAAQFKALQEANPENIYTLEAMSPSFTEVAFNVWEDPASLGNPLLLDKNIREAIEYAIDRESLVEVAFFGYGEIGSTLVPPMYDYWHLKLPPSEFRSYNPDKAREILDAAGYKTGSDGVRVSPTGEPLQFRLFVRTESPDNQKAAMLIKDWLQEIGIALEVSVIDEGTITDRIFESDYDMFIWGWYVDVDPTSILKIMTTAEIMSWSDCFYSNPDYDELHLLQQRQMDREERRETIYQMQRMIYDDVPYIIISYDPEVQAYRTDRYEGWTRNPVNGPVVFTNVKDTYVNLRPIQ